MKKKAARFKSTYKKPEIKKHSINTKLAILVILIVIGIIIIGKLTSMIIKMYSPVYAISPVSRSFVWDGKSNFSFVLKTNVTSVVSYHQAEEKLVIINLPDNLYLNLPTGMGKWQLGSVYDLGNKSSDKNGGVLLKRSLGSLFDIPLEGYVVLDTQKSPQEVIENIRKGLWGSVSLLRNQDSDLTPNEILKLVFGIRSVRFDKVEFLRLEDSDTLSEEKLPDGTVVLVPNSKINNLGKFTESAVEAEKMSVAIFNTTDIPGLAQKVAQLVTNLGGNVIFVGNIEHSRDRSAIFTSNLSGDQKKSDTAQVLGVNFASSCSKDLKCDTIFCDGSRSLDPICQSDPQIIESRAQINLVIGKDFGDRF